MLLADRYLRCPDGWIDLATARSVSVAFREAGARRSQIAWAERCAMLARLHHPLLNPLIDFGVADRTTLFEAYAPRGHLDASAAAARTVITHAMRFLDAQGIQLPQAMATCVLRPVARPRSGGGWRERPIGVVLQPRVALAALEELFGAPGAQSRTSNRCSLPCAAASGGGRRAVAGTGVEWGRNG
jgi:hypothetical protein